MHELSVGQVVGGCASYDGPYTPKVMLVQFVW